MVALIEPQTERLRLRQWRSSDRAPFAALNADPRVMEHFPTTLSRSQSDAVADAIESFIAAHGWGFWAVELKTSAEFIGFVGLYIPSPTLPFSPCVEIGWRLACRYWRHGYATEAAREALRVGFDELALHEIVAYTAVPNRRSRAVMDRLCMIEQPGTFEHPEVPSGHRLREHCVYRLSRERWAASVPRAGQDERISNSRPEATQRAPRGK